MTLPDSNQGFIELSKIQAKRVVILEVAGPVQGAEGLRREASETLG